MSVELHSFVAGPKLPAREDWQRAIDALALPVQLDPELDLNDDSGFSPSRLNGLPSGFEIYVESSAAVLAEYPHLVARVAGREYVISFRWGSDLSQSACALAAAAGLVKGFNALAYYPSDDLVYSNENELVKEFKKCL